ncbi:MAG: AMP-binding protein, partial [Candidatus Saccharimonadales bacterium]
SVNTLCTIAVGNRSYIPRQIKLDEIVNAVAETGAQAVQLSPQVLREIIIDVPRLKNTKLRTVQCWFTGGASFTTEEAARFEAAFPGVVYARYGLTEAAGGLLIQKPGSERAGVGHSMYGTQAEVMPLDGFAAGIGEVRVRTKALAAGYLGRQAEWDRVYRDGWFYTADLGMFDDTGNLHILGRLKNVVMSGVFQVWPSEVETVLRKVPGVKDCAVFGMPDDISGEVVAAVIVPCAGANLSWKDVREFCEFNLLPQKLPRILWLVDQLSVARVKVDINRLRSLLETLATSGPRGHVASVHQQCCEVLSYLLDDEAASKSDRSFKDLGGDSLLAAEICWRLSLLLGRKIPTAALCNSRPLTEFIQTYITPQGVTNGQRIINRP